MSGKHANRLAKLALNRQRLDARREADKVEAHEVETGVAETVALGEARGETFTPGRQKRRLSGLELMRSREQITEAQLAMGERYGRLWRGAYGPEPIKSQLTEGAGKVDGTPTQPESARLACAEGLMVMRRPIRAAKQMIEVCDLICGQEFTPREVAPDGRQAAALTALLCAALDLMEG